MAALPKQKCFYFGNRIAVSCFVSISPIKFSGFSGAVEAMNQRYSYSG